MQVLEEQPTKAVDLLETSALIKRTQVDARESSPLVPISVRTLWQLPWVHGRLTGPGEGEQGEQQFHGRLAGPGNGWWAGREGR